MSHFSIGLWCAMKSGFYTTTSNDQLIGWTEKKLQSTSQSQTCTRKWSWSLFGGLLPLWSTQLSESWWNRYIWKVWSENQWDALKTAMPAASTGRQKWPFFSRTTPDCTVAQPMLQRLNELDYEVLPHLSWVTRPRANQLPLLQASQQLFAGKTLPQPAQGTKCFPRVFQLPKHGFLQYRNKQTYFSLAKMCWLW